MANSKKETLKQKKQELEEEINHIQEELDDSLDDIKSDVSSSLSPRDFVRRHPLPVVGISVLVGFVLGKDDGKTSSSSASSSESSESSAPGDTLSSTLWYEVKRLITRKGIALASDYIEDIFSDSGE